MKTKIKELSFYNQKRIKTNTKLIPVFSTQSLLSYFKPLTKLKEVEEDFYMLKAMFLGFNLIFNKSQFAFYFFIEKWTIH